MGSLRGKAISHKADADSDLDLPDASTTSSATPTASPSADADAIQTDYPQDKLTIRLPELAPADQPVVRAYAGYEAVLRHSYRVVAVSPEASKYAVPDMLKPLQDTVAYLRQKQGSLVGPIVAEVTQVEVSAQVALLNLCLDGKATKYDGAPRTAQRVSLSRTDGGWKVTSYKPTGNHAEDTAQGHPAPSRSSERAAARPSRLRPIGA